MADEAHLAGLTEKQALFVRYYVANRFNATQAAISAGYSPDTAYSIGNENLNKPEIQEALKAEKKRVLEDVDDLRVLWLKEVRSLALSDIRNVTEFDEDGVRHKASKDLDDDTARSIESVESITTYDKAGNRVITRKVKLHSKKGSLDTLGKFLGMLKEDPAAGVTIIINGNETDLA